MNNSKTPRIDPEGDEAPSLRQKSPRLGKFVFLAVVLHVVVLVVVILTFDKESKEPIVLKPVRPAPELPESTRAPHSAPPSPSASPQGHSPGAARPDRPLLYAARESAVSAPFNRSSMSASQLVVPLVTSPSLRSQVPAAAPKTVTDRLGFTKLASGETQPSTSIAREERARQAAMRVAPLRDQQFLPSPVPHSTSQDKIVPAIPLRELPLPSFEPAESGSQRAVSAESKSARPHAALVMQSRDRQALPEPLWQPRMRLDRPAVSGEVKIAWNPARPQELVAVERSQYAASRIILEDAGNSLALRKPTGQPRSADLKQGMLFSVEGRVPGRSQTTGGSSRAMRPKIALPEESPPRLLTVEPLTRPRSPVTLPGHPPRLPQLTDLPAMQSDGMGEAITELVGRLVQPTPLAPAELNTRVQVENLTYRDLVVESEGTKLISRLVTAGLGQQGQVKVLSPEEVLQSPHTVVKGQVWEDAEGVMVRLQLVDSETGRELSTTQSHIPRDKLPRQVAFAPPEGQSLGIVQKVVSLMQQSFPNGGDFRLGVWLDKGVDAVYAEGEKLLVRILAETDAYLQVDYYQADGQVVHILPNPLDSNVVEGGKPLVIGTPESGYEYPVTAPFGEELLLVIASQEPLAAETSSQSMVEPATAYLDRLSKHLETQKAQGKVAAAHVVVVTKKR